MAPKRKMEITAVDECDRLLYSLFQNTANNLSELYALSNAQRQTAFAAGQDFAIRKIYEWIIEKLQEGRGLVTVPDILGHLQAMLRDGELDIGQPEQGEGSGSGQSSASVEMGVSESAQDEDSDPDMQMD